jgi:hypothetical protein
MRFKLKIKISGFEINKKFEEFSNRINNIIYRGKKKKKTNTVIINSNKKINKKSYIRLIYRSLSSKVKGQNLKKFYHKS